MNDWIPPSGESKSTLTATDAAIGTGDAAAGAVGRVTGDMEASSKCSARSARNNTGKGHKKAVEPLPVQDALSIFQEAARMLQEAGLPVQAVQLPVSPDTPPRVAIILQGVTYDTGNLSLSKNLAL